VSEGGKSKKPLPAMVRIHQNAHTGRASAESRGTSGGSGRLGGEGVIRTVLIKGVGTRKKV